MITPVPSQIQPLMKRIDRRIDAVDVSLTTWMAQHSLALLRCALGLVFFWFGVLKFFPGLSPAQDLATRTISTLTLGLVHPQVSLPLLALWECTIGLGLFLNRSKRITLLLLFVQMIGTILPLFFFPMQTFTHFPYAPTLEGQYIIKNVVLISAALVLGATVRAGHRVTLDS